MLVIMSGVHTNNYSTNMTADPCSPLFVEYRLMKELTLFQQQTIQNVYLVPSYESPFKWFGVLFVHEGFYQGAVFRFTFLIPENYGHYDDTDTDDSGPSIFFDLPPFHPLVDPETGKFDSSKMFAQWNPRVNQFWQLIVYLKQAFINVENELKYEAIEGSPKSEDVTYLKVVAMFRENQELFVNKIAQTVESSKSSIYHPPRDKDDPHAIIFTEVDPSTVESWKNHLLNFANKSNSFSPKTTSTPSKSSSLNANRTNIGLSWVQNGIPFSRPTV